MAETIMEMPEGIKERIDRAKGAMREGTAKRNECAAMWRGDQYVQRDGEGYLTQQGTLVGQKPSHRPRRTRNLVHGLVEAKVSAASQRVPSYEINPTSTDPEKIQAAHLSAKVALFGYEKWNIARVTKKAVTSALVMDGGYAMPFWDATVGPFLEGNIGQGEIRIRTFTGNEVGWEPGCEFEASPYHVLVQARPVDEVQRMPGFLSDDKHPLSADAAAYAILNAGTGGSAQAKLVMVTEYLERPTPEYPQGRKLVEANGRQILPEEPYPCATYGYDGICLHPLTYTVDPDSDHDRGMAIHMLDAQRTYNRCTNMQESWAQLALNPQIIGPPMANKIKFTDEPGAYYTVVPINGMVPQWRDVPPIPPELAQMKQEAKFDMQMIAGSDDIPENVDSAKGMQTAIEQARQRWAAFMSDVAKFHSRLMRHCLTLVQAYYNEDRLISIRGRFGWENVEAFRGAKLCDQVDVTVLPGSIEPRTRQAIETRVQWIVQTFPGYVSPEAALAAIEGGTGEKLIESYELDLMRANTMLQKILAGPEVLFAQPLVDPTQPPAWAPREFDNVAVHMHLFADFMKTPDFDSQPAPIQEALRLYYDGCKFLKEQAQIREQMQQNAMAADQGMANAAKTPATKPMPSLPALQH